VSTEPGLRISTEGLAKLGKDGTIWEIAVGDDAAGKEFDCGVGRGKTGWVIWVYGNGADMLEKIYWGEGGWYVGAEMGIKGNLMGVNGELHSGDALGLEMYRMNVVVSETSLVVVGQTGEADDNMWERSMLIEIKWGPTKLKHTFIQINKVLRK
jgi:hypothetical protein